MRKLRSSVSWLFLAVAMFSMVSFAEGRRDRGFNFDREVGARGMLKGLNLSEEQREKVKAIREKQESKVSSLRDRVKSAQEAFQNAQRSNESKSSILSKFDSLSELRTQMARARVEGMLEIREILTDEQREIASKMMGQRRDRIRDKMERRKEKRKERRKNKQGSENSDES